MSSSQQQSSSTSSSMYRLDHNHEVSFPFPPYESQILFMTKIVETLSHELGTQHHALFESPTGTGKSLSLLCASLCWQNTFKAQRIVEWKQWYETDFKNASNSMKRSISETDVSDSLDEPASKRLRVDLTTEVSLENADALPLSSAKVNADILKKQKLREQAQLKEVQKILRYLELGYHHKAEQHMLSSSKFKGNGVNSIVPKIFFATRTHSQIKQIVRELKKTTYRPQMVVLASRDHYCIHPQVRSNPNKNDECKKKTEHNQCKYYKHYKELAEMTDIMPGGRLEVFDIEDLIQLGQKQQGCPYFGSHQIMLRAELVFCPYNYLIDPIIREAMSIDLKGAIVILDEAHNIEDISRDAASATVTLAELNSVIDEFSILIENRTKSNIHGPMRAFIEKLISWLDAQESKFITSQRDTKILKLTTRNAMMNMLEHLGLIRSSDLNISGFETYFQMYRDILHYANTPESKDDLHTLSTKSQIALEKLFIVFEFMLDNNVQYLSDYVVLLQKKKIYYQPKVGKFNRKSSSKANEEIWETSFNFWCMNPATAFDELKKKCHSVILTSGTLSPMNSFSSELGTHFKTTFEAPHVIDLNKQVWVGQQSSGPNNIVLNGTHANISNSDFQDSLGELILDHCRIIPFGVLVFFPSYSVMDKMQTRWTQTGLLKQIKKVKEPFFEPRASDKETSFADCINSYYNFIDNITSKSMTTGAIFFAVCRGKVSEGIDLKDNYCRGVIVVGIPFPNFTDPQVEEKRKYNDTKRSSSPDAISGETWYCLQAYRAVNQAIGRCLRHKHDYGAIIMVDDRYKDQRHINNLSKWVRNCIQKHSTYASGLNSLRQFFDNIKQNPIIAPSYIEPKSEEAKVVIHVKKAKKKQTQLDVFVNDLTDSPPATQQMPPPESSSRRVKREKIRIKNEAARAETIVIDDSDDIAPTQVFDSNNVKIEKSTIKVEDPHTPSPISNSQSFIMIEDVSSEMPTQVVPATKVSPRPQRQLLFGTSPKEAKSPVDLNDILLVCKNCSKIIIQRKSSNRALDKRQQADYPFLTSMSASLTSTTIPEDGYFYQLPPPRLKPYPFRVHVTKKVADSLVQSSVGSDESERIQINDCPVDVPRSCLDRSEQGVIVNTGWIPADGMVYELLFCRNCKTSCCGVQIKATNATNLQHIDTIFLFPEAAVPPSKDLTPEEIGSPSSQSEFSQFVEALFPFYN